MRVLVLGGAGFIGRHAVDALVGRGHDVVVGTRNPARAKRRFPCCDFEEVHLESRTAPVSWHSVIATFDVVVNAVGILRERRSETYDRVHHRAAGALAEACALTGRRLVHVSALGLHADARSRFIRSKLRGEAAIAASGCDYTLVRPSLLEGPGGFGARWLAALARLPVHFVPADANGRIAVMHVRDLGRAIAVLCEARSREEWREVELGGSEHRTMAEYLEHVRGAPALLIRVPPLIARIASHLCDLLHFSPFSFGHLELMRRDNLPRTNLLGRLVAPRAAFPTDDAGWSSPAWSALRPLP
jgi:uncharacterized protein YbjT (DUF2867 family)